MIEQLAGARRRVELDADDLPDQGAESGVEQRVQTRWAPGAAEPVVQVLGPRHLPLTLRGLWDSVTTRYEDVRSLVETMTAIVTDGVRVRLVWGEVWRREGLILRFTPRWDLESMVGWELELDTHQGEGSSTQALRLRAQQTRADADGAAVALKAAAVASLATQQGVARVSWLAGVDV